MAVDWIKDFMKPEFIWARVGLIRMLLEFAVPGLSIFFFGAGACDRCGDLFVR